MSTSPPRRPPPRGAAPGPRPGGASGPKAAPGTRPGAGQGGRPGGRAGARPGGRPGARPGATPKPLEDGEIRELQGLLDAVPSPLESLDVSMVDGFLCGVIVQAEPIPPPRWLRYITDVEGRPLPPRFDVTRLHALVLRRHAELAEAIGERHWFDPWIFDLSEEGSDPTDDAEDRGDDRGDDHDNEAPTAEDSESAREAVLPWVAGIATAFEAFPALTRKTTEATLEPLALLYRHLDPDDLEDADDLLAEIETFEPVTDLADAVEGLVRATLLLADASSALD